MGLGLCLGDELSNLPLQLDFVLFDLFVELPKHSFWQVLAVVDATVVLDKLFDRHSADILNHWVVKIRVQHDCRKGQDESGIGVLKNSLFALLAVKFVRKCFHKTIDALGFSRHSELGQEQSKSSSKRGFIREIVFLGERQSNVVLKRVVFLGSFGKVFTNVDFVKTRCTIQDVRNTSRSIVDDAALSSNLEPLFALRIFVKSL